MVAVWWLAQLLWWPYTLPLALAAAALVIKLTWRRYLRCRLSRECFARTARGCVYLLLLLGRLGALE